MSFRLSYYRVMIANLGAAGRQFVTVAEGIALPAAQVRYACMLRHDVDRLPARSVAMARLEHTLGVRSTYYFRCTRNGRFPSAAIATIAGLGHEVGYHYETLSHFGGDMSQAVAAFHKNLANFRTLAPCRSVSMHGAPLSRHDNFMLVGCVDLHALHLVDAMRDMAPLNPVYFTDTGGSWNAGGHRNRRDAVGEVPVQAPDFLDPSAAAAFSHGLPRLLYINTHPERWPSTRLGYVQAAATDALVNVAKRCARHVA